MSGTATLGTDYVLSGAPGQVTIPAGQSSGTVTLKAKRDNVQENTETAVMTLQPGTGYRLGANKQATVSILNGPWSFSHRAGASQQSRDQRIAHLAFALPRSARSGNQIRGEIKPRTKDTKVNKGKITLCFAVPVVASVRAFRFSAVLALAPYIAPTSPWTSWPLSVFWIIELESARSFLVVSQPAKNAVTMRTSAKTEPSRNTSTMSILRCRGRCIEDLTKEPVKRYKKFERRAP
jgi:hypothetical protein